MSLINISGFNPINGGGLNTPIGLSQLGTVVYDDITFPAGSYYNLKREQIAYSELKLQSVQVSVNQVKRISKTEIASKNGTFKQYSSLGDYIISLNGIIAEFFNVFPYDQLRAFRNVSESNIAISILSKVLNDGFNIYSVVIDSFDISTVQGSMNQVTFAMSLSSDEDLDLKSFLL